MLGRRMISLPVFNLWDTQGSSIISDICFETATYNHLVNDDHLFHDGTDAKGAFCVVSGRLSYLQSPEKSAVDTFQEQKMERDTWLCEAALWTYWVHVGTCEAMSTSQVVLVQSTPLAAVVQRNRHVRELAVAYASAFHTRLVQCSCIESEITDLVVPGAEFEDVVETLPREARRMLEEVALEKEIALTPKKTSYWRALQNLDYKVAHDGCFLFYNGDKQLHRVVWSTCARFRQRCDTNLFLVVLGSVEDGHVTATCRLLETEGSGRDDIDASLRTLIDLELSSVSPWLKTLSVSGPADIGWEDDRNFCLQSKYKRLMFELVYDGNLEVSVSGCPVAKRTDRTLLRNTEDVCVKVRRGHDGDLRGRG